MQAQVRQGGLNGGHGGEHVAITHEAQVADAEHLALEVVLAAGQKDVELLLHGLAHRFCVDALGGHRGDGGAAMALGGVEGQADGLHAGLGGV